MDVIIINDNNDLPKKQFESHSHSSFSNSKTSNPSSPML